MNREAVARELVAVVKLLADESSSSIDGVNNIKARKFVNMLLNKHTHGVFKDEAWHPVQETFRALREAGVEFVITSSDYTKNEKGVPNAKEWKLEFPFVNDKGKSTVLYGIIRASGMGPMDDILAKYDIVTYAS
jgi:hypothetical protein